MLLWLACQYSRQHVIVAIDPNSTYFPSDVRLPLGEPGTETYEILSRRGCFLILSYIQDKKIIILSCIQDGRWNREQASNKGNNARSKRDVCELLQLIEVGASYFLEEGC